MDEFKSHLRPDTTGHHQNQQSTGLIVFEIYQNCAHPKMPRTVATGFKFREYGNFDERQSAGVCTVASGLVKRDLS